MRSIRYYFYKSFTNLTLSFVAFLAIFLTSFSAGVKAQTRVQDKEKTDSAADPS